MKKIIVAFDIDGTLINNETNEIVANEDIRTLLITLSKFKNIKILVWSGGGELYANQVVRSLGIRKYVWKCAGKNHLGKDKDGKHLFKPDIVPDIAIDDIQDCNLGLLNLIVKEK